MADRHLHRRTLSRACLSDMSVYMRRWVCVGFYSRQYSFLTPFYRYGNCLLPVPVRGTWYERYIVTRLETPARSIPLYCTYGTGTYLSSLERTSLLLTRLRYVRNVERKQKQEESSKDLAHDIHHIEEIETESFNHDNNSRGRDLRGGYRR
jgi:hypothetical protein